MATARKNQVDLEATSFYHCIGKCIRGTYILDIKSQNCEKFNHRKVWLVDLIKALPQVFAIDVCAYAIMSNHYHLVLRVDKTKAQSWSDEEVIERWAGLFKFSEAKKLLDLGLCEDVLERNREKINDLRMRLYDISWFIKALNERIARTANKEDGAKGKFWESRFRSQALLDESAILTCMSYVDLNPIRAGVAQTPESSDFTSIKERIKEFKRQGQVSQPKDLVPFQTAGQVNNPLPLSLEDYFELVDESGRVIREDKKGFIPDYLHPILQRLEISPSGWISNLLNFESNFETFVGRSQSIRNIRSRKNQRMRGVTQSESSFSFAV